MTNNKDLMSYDYDGNLVEMPEPVEQPARQWLPPNSVTEFCIRYLNGVELGTAQKICVDKFLSAEHLAFKLGIQGGKTFVRRAIIRMLEEAEAPEEWAKRQTTIPNTNS